MVEHKDAGRRDYVEERKRKPDIAQAEAIAAAKLAQQQANESGKQQQNEPKQQRRK